MFCRKTFYAKMKMMQQRTFKIVFNRDTSYDTSFTQVSLHEKNLKLLAKELCKSINDKNPKFLKIIPNLRNSRRLPT